MDLRKMAQAKLAEFRSKTFAELAAQPINNTEEVRQGRRRVLLTVWRDETAADQLRIVVQAYRPLLLGIGHAAAVGFQISKSGSARDLAEDELYEFR